MKYVITGSLGKISKPLAKALVENGHDVVVVSRNSDNIGHIEAIGATAAIGSVEDPGFLTRIFEGADGVYTMVPPNWSAGDYRKYISGVGRQYKRAIEASGINKVVNLSSIGADLPDGTGSIAGLHDVETILNELGGVAIRHLRAGLFYTNFFFDIPVIRAMGVMGNNYANDTQLVMVHPKDIATAAAAELQSSFAGKGYRYVASEQGRVGDFVKLIGTALGKPDLPWVQFSDEELLKGLIGAGMSEAIAALYVEMGHAIGTGTLYREFEKNMPEFWGESKFVDFLAVFVAVYNSGK